jgi:hypothetical protein
MTVPRERRPAPPAPELDREDEVDLGRYWSTVAARWWLPLLGLLAGAAIGYLLSLGGGSVYVAKATVYLGVPFSPTGNVAIQSPNTSPRTINVLIHSEAGLRQAAARSGLRIGRLRGAVSSSAAVGAASLGAPAAKGTAAQYSTISVQGEAPRKTRDAANALADYVIANVSGYVDTKIAGYRRQLAGIDADLRSNELRTGALNAAVKGANGLSPIDQLVLISQLDNAEQRRGALLDSQTQTQQLLALAKTVERPRVLARATAVKTTARSKRNSAVVGAFLGLLLGLAAALLWERFARRPAV